MTTKFFRLTTRTFWRFKGEMCERCKKPFEFSDDVVSKRSANHEVIRFYHQSCWNKLYIDV